MVRFVSSSPKPISLAALLVLGLGLLAAPDSTVAQVDQRLQARCRICHSDRFATTAAGPHAVIDEPGRAESFGVSFSCTACHGDVTEHIAAAGRAPVRAFRGEAPAEESAVCLDCHRDDHPRFTGSVHAEAGLACTDCHSQHEGMLDAALIRRGASLLASVDRTSPKSSLCADCHGDVYASFSLNEHHRLTEGILECTSCHDPHALRATPTLGGFEHQTCTDCHADKGGPFIFEHEVSRVEGCTACHSPHGSPNRHMLRTQRVGELCISCHSVLPQFHVGFSPSGPPRFTLDTQCTSCHSAIHGSNFDPHFLR